MDKKDKNVGTGLVGAPACGDVMKLQVGRTLILQLHNLITYELLHHELVNLI